jgi:hypothetical protein
LSPGSQLVTNEGIDKTAIAPRGFEDPKPGEPPCVYGAVVCSWGLHASLVADSDTAEYRKHGDQRFYMAAKELLTPSDGSGSHRYKGNVWAIKRNADGGEERCLMGGPEHMYVLVTLVSDLQKGFKISPASKPLDGKLRLVHLGVVEPLEAMRVLDLAGDGGKHVDEKCVDYRDVDGLRIEFLEAEDRWRRICVDGKIILIPKGGWMEVTKERREAVKLIVPKDVALDTLG